MAINKVFSILLASGILMAGNHVFGQTDSIKTAESMKSKTKLTLKQQLELNGETPATNLQKAQAAEAASADQQVKGKQKNKKELGKQLEEQATMQAEGIKEDAQSLSPQVEEQPADGQKKQAVENAPGAKPAITGTNGVAAKPVAGASKKAVNNKAKKKLTTKRKTSKKVTAKKKAKALK